MENPFEKGLFHTFPKTFIFPPFCALNFILCVLILLYVSVSEIRNKEARAEVKEALELVKKANALCKEAK